MAVKFCKTGHHVDIGTVYLVYDSVKFRFPGTSNTESDNLDK